MILSEQTKVALAAHASNINTQLEFRFLNNDDMAWSPHYGGPFFLNVCAYRVKHTETIPHPYADVIVAFINDPTVEIQYKFPEDIDWHVMDSNLALTFFPEATYEIMPKKG